MRDLIDAVYRDPSYKSQGSLDQYEVLTRDTVLGIDFLAQAIPTNQWSWAEKTRGTVYDEIIVTENAIRVMEYPQYLPEVLSRCQVDGGPGSSALYFLAHNDQLVSKVVGSKIAKCSSLEEDFVGTMSEEFDFPASLFRRTMIPYFEDYRRPTREEFLFALMMENISGSTAREKKAIEEAHLHVKNKGN